MVDDFPASFAEKVVGRANVSLETLDSVTGKKILALADFANGASGGTAEGPNR